MADSIAVIFRFPEQAEKSNFPYQMATTTDESGQIRARHPKAMFIRSPMIPEAKFKATAILSDNPSNGTLVTGYWVEINVPACTVGNNVLIENRVHSASLIALLMLQYWLIEGGVEPKTVKSLKLADAELQSVTLTYIFDCESNASAKACKSLMKSRGQILANRKVSRGSKKPGFAVGAETDETIYFKHRDFKIKGYVKECATDDGISVFSDRKASEFLYSIGRQSLRVEIELKHSWLHKNRLLSPICWKVGADQDLHLVGLLLIQKYLRLDKEYRSRRPSEEHMKKLAPLDREVLKSHLAGGNSRSHSHLDRRRNRLSRQKHYSAMRQRIMKKLDIDIAIKWEDQRSRFSRQLPELLVSTNMVGIPAKLRMHCFCTETIDEIIIELKAKLRKLSKS